MQMLGGYGELAFQFGLLDENQKAFVDSETMKAINSIKKKDFYGAFKVSLDLHAYTAVPDYVWQSQVENSHSRCMYPCALMLVFYM